LDRVRVWGANVFDRLFHHVFDASTSNRWPL